MVQACTRGRGFRGKPSRGTSQTGSWYGPTFGSPTQPATISPRPLTSETEQLRYIVLAEVGLRLTRRRSTINSRSQHIQLVRRVEERHRRVIADGGGGTSFDGKSEARSSGIGRFWPRGTAGQRGMKEGAGYPPWPDAVVCEATHVFRDCAIIWDEMEVIVGCRRGK